MLDSGLAIAYLGGLSWDLGSEAGGGMWIGPFGWFSVRRLGITCWEGMLFSR